jgi:dsDNA-binding SOS-regulon protein
MAVITRYIVVRNGVELDKVFDVKKEADAYDKMLDAAENLAAFIKQSDLEVDLNTETVDAISICLAKNAPEVTKILKGIKPIVPATDAPGKIEKPLDPEPVKDKKAPGKKAKSKPKRK